MQDSLKLYSRIMMRLARSLHQRSVDMPRDQKQGVDAIYERSQRIVATLSRIDCVPVNEARVYKHEVRNMMTPVLGYTQLLASDRLGQIDSTMQTDCEIILRCVRKLHSELDNWCQQIETSALV